MHQCVSYASGTSFVQNHIMHHYSKKYKESENHYLQILHDLELANSGTKIKQ